MKKNYVISFLLVVTTLSVFSQGLTDSLVCYLPFNGNANDVSGNFNDGIVHGATLTTDRFGNENSAYSFDGINNYIDLSFNAASFDFQQPASISCWIKTNYDNPQTIFSVSDTTTTTDFNIAVVYVGNNTTGTMTDELINVANRENASDDYVIGYTTKDRFWLFDNDWHHIVIVYTDSLTKIYLDKHLLPITSYKTNTGHFGNLGFPNSATIGTRYHKGYGAFLNGSIDEFRMYKRTLDSVDIAALYNEVSYSCTEKISISDTLIINANLLTTNPIKYLNTIKIYPNPAKDHIYIDADENSTGYYIKIINELSQTVFQTSIHQPQYYVDLSTWSGLGVYYIQFYNNDGVLKDVKKIILQ